MSVQPSFISDCSAYDPSYAQYTAYDYQPSLAAGVIFTTLFGLSALLHAYQTWRTRRFWQIAFVAGGIGECLGWLARAIAWRCPYSATYFEMQISLLIFCKHPYFTRCVLLLIYRQLRRSSLLGSTRSSSFLFLSSVLTPRPSLASSTFGSS